MSLRLRLNLIITLLMLLLMLGVGFIMINAAKSSTQQSVEAATHVTTQLLDALIISTASSLSFGYTNGVMRQFLGQLGRVRSNQIFLYDYRDVLIYKSPKPEYRIDVKPPQWFYNILDPKAEPVMRVVRLGQLGRLEVRPDPGGTIRESWVKIKQVFWIWLGFFVVLNVGVYWMLGRLLKPLQSILKTINQLEQGDLSARLPHFRLPEFEKIGHSLNRLAESLTVEHELEENRQLTHLIQEHIEQERRSLARELHDELGQYVTAIKTFAVTIASKTKEKAPEVEASAQAIVGAANHIYDGMHHIIKQLRPGALDNLGLTETLKDLANALQEQHSGLSVKLSLAGALNELGETINISIYRIVQESINNAIKHAEANKLNIGLMMVGEDTLQLTITDNGKGMDIQAVDQANHFGLLGIRERVQGLHGSFKIKSELGKGTAIMITMPLAINQGTKE